MFVGFVLFISLTKKIEEILYFAKQFSSTYTKKKKTDT